MKGGSVFLVTINNAYIRRKRMKRKIIIIVKVLFLALIVLLVNAILAAWLYGDREIVEFPFEMVSELPPEPDWHKENAFDQILYDKQAEKEIQEWFKRIFKEDKYVVNKSGDPIPLHTCEESSLYGLTFYSNNGNLVVVYNSMTGRLMRMEVLEKSIRKGSKRCPYTEEEIANSWDNSYIDYENNNTLYYYVNGEMLKIDDNVHQIEGHYINDVATFPIFQKNGKIQAYILEDAESEYIGEFEYRTEKIKIREVIFYDLETSCYVENIGLGQQLLRIINEKESMQFYVRKDLKEGKHDVQQIISLLQKEDFIKKEAKEKYIYLNRSLGYDDPWLW